MNRLNKNDATIYCIYHDIYVMVAFHKNEQNVALKKINGKMDASFFYFTNEVLPKDYAYKKMKFSEYIKLLKTKRLQFFSYANAPEIAKYGFHIDAYKSFTKPELDNFLKRYPEHKEQYNFLFE